jgi:uncharacterized membrane protein
MMTTIFAVFTVRTPRELDELTVQTYILGAVVGAIFLLLAATIAQAIKFEGGAHPKDPRKRRLCFWFLMIVSFATFFLYNYFAVAPTVSTNLQARFMTTNLIGSVIVIGVYVVGGFVLSKIFSTGKLANWFSSSR